MTVREAEAVMAREETTVWSPDAAATVVETEFPAL